MVKDGIPKNVSFSVVLQKRKFCDRDKAESYVTNGFVGRQGFLVKSLTPLHFLGLWPIGRRNAALIGTSADSYYPHCSMSLLPTLGSTQSRCL